MHIGWSWPVPAARDCCERRIEERLKIVGDGARETLAQELPLIGRPSHGGSLDIEQLADPLHGLVGNRCLAGDMAVVELAAQAAEADAREVELAVAKAGLVAKALPANRHLRAGWRRT